MERFATRSRGSIRLINPGIAGVFDGGAGLADAAHAVDGALAIDDDGAFGGEVLAEFGEELIAAFEQGAEGGREMMNYEG